MSSGSCDYMHLSLSQNCCCHTFFSRIYYLFCKNVLYFYINFVEITFAKLTLKRAEVPRLTVTIMNIFWNRPRLQCERSKSGVWQLHHRQGVANMLPLPCSQSVIVTRIVAKPEPLPWNDMHENPRKWKARCHYPVTEP